MAPSVWTHRLKSPRSFNVQLVLLLHDSLRATSEAAGVSVTDASPDAGETVTSHAPGSERHVVQLPHRADARSVPVSAQRGAPEQTGMTHTPPPTADASEAEPCTSLRLRCCLGVLAVVTVGNVCFT